MSGVEASRTVKKNQVPTVGQSTFPDDIDGELG
jgi:hypothetical protein